MKKSLLSLALLLMIGVSAVFAGDSEGVSKKIVNAFRNDFAEAKDIKWQPSRDYVKVTFSLNNQVLFAWYSTDEGKLLGVVRNIVSSQLPIKLQSDLRRNYSDLWISDLFEVADQHSTTYYVTLENADNKLVLKSTGSQGWIMYKKEKKYSEQ